MLVKLHIESHLEVYLTSAVAPQEKKDEDELSMVANRFSFLAQLSQLRLDLDTEEAVLKE